MWYIISTLPYSHCNCSVSVVIFVAKTQLLTFISKHIELYHKYPCMHIYLYVEKLMTPWILYNNISKSFLVQPWLLHILVEFHTVQSLSCGVIRKHFYLLYIIIYSVIKYPHSIYGYWNVKTAFECWKSLIETPTLSEIRVFWGSWENIKVFLQTLRFSRSRKGFSAALRFSSSLIGFFNSH